MIEAVVDQDPQRVCVLQGPVAVKHSTRVDERAFAPSRRS